MGNSHCLNIWPAIYMPYYPRLVIVVLMALYSIWANISLVSSKFFPAVSRRRNHAHKKPKNVRAEKNQNVSLGSRLFSNSIDGTACPVSFAIQSYSLLCRWAYTYLGQSIPIGIMKAHQKTGSDGSNTQWEDLCVDQVLD